MGIPGISWPQLLIILVIVLLIFGTKRIRSLGSDIGGAIREFRKGIGENDEDDGDNAGEGIEKSSGGGASQDKDTGSSRES